jgi:hypothetical protein
MINTSKKVIEKSQQFISSWTEFAPEASLAGKTLAQFVADSQTPSEAQALIVSAKTKYKGYINDRNEAILVLRDQLVALANAVRCDPNHGFNSAFYRSLGYVTQTERKSPVRKATTAEPAVTPPAANAA